MTNAECNIQRISKVDRDEFNCSYDEWVENEKNFDHYNPTIIQYHTKIRAFLDNRGYKEQEDYLLRTDKGGGVDVHIHTSKCNLKLILDLLDYLHINPSKYHACRLGSNSTYVMYQDYVAVGIGEELLVKQSYQDTLM